jgi:hypothetical protein
VSSYFGTTMYGTRHMLLILGQKKPDDKTDMLNYSDITLTFIHIDRHGKIIEICLNCHNYVFIYGFDLFLTKENAYDKTYTFNYSDMSLTFLLTLTSDVKLKKFSSREFCTFSFNSFFNINKT